MITNTITSLRKGRDGITEIIPSLANKVYVYLKNNCVGKERAIKKPALAIALLGEATESNLRILRDATQWLSAQRNERGEGLSIGFSTSYGYYIIDNAEELKAYIETCAGYKAKAEIRHASALLIRLHNDDWFWKDKIKKQELLF